MKQDKEQLLKNLEKKILEIILELDKRCYFSYSTLKEVIEIIKNQEAAEKFKKETLELILSRNKFLNKKDLGIAILKELRKQAYPIKSKKMLEFNKLLNEIKDKNIKINYPKNFEGDTINIEIEFKNTVDIEKTLKILNEKKNILKEIINFVKSGGFCNDLY